MPAAVDEGLGGRHALRWQFDADLAVAALDWTTVDVPLLYWQLKFLHHSTPFPGLRSKELWYGSVLKSSSLKECSSFSSCASRTSPTPVAIIHSITEKSSSRKLEHRKSCAAMSRDLLTFDYFDHRVGRYHSVLARSYYPDPAGQ